MSESRSSRSPRRPDDASVPRAGAATQSRQAGLIADNAGGRQTAGVRHPYGPRPLAALVPALLRPTLDRNPTASAQVIADWGLIVGAALSARTRPRRLAAGTLTVACAGPEAMELQHGADMLIERINRHLGHAVVQRLRLVHEAIAAPAPLLPRKTASAAERADVEASLGDLPEGPLREALARLAIAMQGG